MKKFLITTVLVVSFFLYASYERQNLKNTQVTEITAPANSDSQNSKTDPANNSSSISVSAGQYKDGSYTGTVADAVYGSLQAKAVITDGKISDVQFLQFPNSSAHSQQVSSVTLPQLKTEAIAAQSANVDTISGATQDSTAFRQTLGSALAQAK